VRKKRDEEEKAKMQNLRKEENERKHFEEREKIRQEKEFERKSKVVELKINSNAKRELIEGFNVQSFTTPFHEDPFSKGSNPIFKLFFLFH